MKQPHSQHGFALMIALMLMVFLVLLMISLTSLVRADFQTANAAHSQSLARQNALLGLQIALGQLQEHSGSDMRVTAQSAILETGPENNPTIANPRWTGVWKANTAGNAAELVTWFVSGNQTLLPTDADFVTPNSALGTNESVEIVGIGTTLADSVRVPSVTVENGHFAYWISEQQTKALINMGKDSATEPTPTFPATISSRHLFTHLNLSVAPEESTSVGNSFTFPQVAQSLSLTAADRQQLSNHYHDLTIASDGLLTDTKRGGLKVDLSALLAGALPPEYSGEPIYEAAAEITADPFATQSPTWDYLKSYYDLRLEVINNGGVAPRPSSTGVHGISPVIAMFGYGFGGGLDVDNRVLVNIYPRLVLYNPYNVTLKARDYVLVLFGNQPLRNEGTFGKYEYHYMPIAGGAMNGTYHKNGGMNYEMGKSFSYSGDSTQTDLARRTDMESAGPAPDAGSPPGMPRFLVEAPDILPGEAVIFTPESQSNYDRYAVANQKLTPGLRGHSFRWHTRAYLKEDPSGVDPDSIIWSLYGNTSLPVYIDAALVETEADADVMRSYTTGVQRHLYRCDADAFRNRVFQLTGRIPVRRPSTPPTSMPYYYGMPNPNPGAEFGWSAQAFTPSAAIKTRPYIHFNPRAKDLDPRNIANTHGDNQHYFYTPYAGANMPLPETYDNNRKVYIGGDYTQSGGTRSFVLYDIPQDAAGLHSLGQLQHMQVSEHFDEPGYAIGNSWASPHISRDKLYKQGAGISSGLTSAAYIGDIDYSAVDISYLLNDALWDRYFFSTIRNIGEDGDNSFHKPVNPRYHFTESFTSNTLANAETNANSLYVSGAFNVNSTSVAAWRAVLSGLHGITLNGSTLEYPFFRSPRPTGASGDPWAVIR